MKNLIAAGFNVDKEKGYFTGLAVMHDLFISVARDGGYRVYSVSLNSKSTKVGKVGVFSFIRLVDYVAIIIKVFCLLLTKKKPILYFNPSTNKSGFYRDVLFIWLTKVLGAKIVMQQFGALFERFKNSLSGHNKRKLERNYNKVDLLIVEGEYAKSQYGFIKNQNIIKVIQNGIPSSSHIYLEAKVFNQSADTFKLFFMNNMIESKGYMDVLKAVDILVNEKRLNVDCTFAGRFMSVIDDSIFHSAEEAQKWFNDYVREKNLTECVHYLNCVFDEVKDKIFRKSHAFLLPSYYIFEGQPTAILESLSYGCVPIVTKYRLIPDMVNEDCGIFVEAKNPRSIADAIQDLMYKPEYYKFLSRNCIDRFNDNFTKEIYSRNILEALNEVN